MKQITILLTSLFILTSCYNKTERQKGEAVCGFQEKMVQTKNTNEELKTTTSDQIFEYSEHESESNEIPPNGKYRFDIAFAEWQGKSLGEKVTIVIKGDSIRVIYGGDGQLTLTVPGEVLDEGILRKHKSGQWIITKSEKDTEIDEIGGCTGGPSVIDFKNKKFWMC